jgi:hypothetical protein
MNHFHKTIDRLGSSHISVLRFESVILRFSTNIVIPILLVTGELEMPRVVI